MRLADFLLVLGKSVRRAFLAKSVRFAWYACGVGDYTARSLCPLASLAHSVRNAHVVLFLGLRVVGRGLGSEVALGARIALGIRHGIARHLRPLTRFAHLVRCYTSTAG